MPSPWIPDMNLYSQVIEFGLKANADNYIQAGWQLIETRTTLIRDAAILVYRVGWLRSAGEPPSPSVIDEDPRSYPQDMNPSAN